MTGDLLIKSNPGQNHAYTLKVKNVFTAVVLVLGEFICINHSCVFDKTI